MLRLRPASAVRLAAAGLALAPLALPSQALLGQAALGRSGAAADAPRPSLAPRDVLDFERHPAGRVAGESLSLLGDGPIVVNGRSSALGAPNAALVLDSASPRHGTDVATPGVAFGGAGTGAGGAPGSLWENRAALGHVLAVADVLDDADANGLVDRPGDADGASEAVLDLDFSAVGPVVLHSLTVVDVKSPTAAVVLYAENGAPLKAVALPLVGDNGVAVVDLGDVHGVASMRVRLDGSGAIDDVVFSRDRKARVETAVWYDRDGDGLRGPDDPGLSGVRVQLADALGRLVDVGVTRYDGRVVFRGLVAGPYLLGIDETSLPARFAPTLHEVGLDDGLDSELSPAPVVLATNASLAGETSFGFVSECSGGIGDFVWFDEDEDGRQDPGEPGIQGVTVRLYEAIVKGGQSFQGEIFDELVTGENGFYAFVGLCPGPYFVEVDESTLPPFFEPTLCDVGPDITDSECSPAAVLVRSDIWTTRSIDFGYVSPYEGRIGDFVWQDDDCDGFQDLGDDPTLLAGGGERGLRGARIILNDDMGVVIAETTSMQNGRYEFVGLAPGVYEVGVDESSVMEGLVPSPCNPGLSDETDNDCSGVTVVLGGDAPALAEGALGSGGHPSGDPVVTFIYDFGYRENPCMGSGCARGLWRAFPDAWPAPYGEGTPFDDVFEKAYPGLSLRDVLELDANGLDAVARQAVAALLNAASPSVDYPLSVEEVLAYFAEALALRNTPAAVLLPEKGRYLQFLNEQICPFGG